ncbi:MAG: alpha-mannosidase [Phycisphaerae bacterium]|nr:alpha-mannosidase [Phycisphaerae bacterium]
MRPRSDIVVLTRFLAVLPLVVGLVARAEEPQAAPASQPSLNEYTIHVMPQSHMDPVWRWRLYEGYDLVHDTFAQAIRFVDERESFIFNQSSAWMFELIERTDPELFAKIDKAVRAGRWCVVGGSWVEADQNLTGGEAMVRQYLYGQRYFRDKFGVQATVGWNVDSFGHAWSLPQIMRKSGIDSNVITRCGPGKIIYTWQGPDGSGVTCVDVRALINIAGKAFKGIKSPAQIFGMAPRLRQVLDEIGLKHLCAATVVGDHGGGPTRQELGILDAVGQMKNMPKVVIDRADRAFKAMTESAGELPVYRDQQNYTYEGCYSSQMEVKRRNRMDEQWLATAEKACALAGVFASAEYPAEALRQAWRHVLFNQFHDILPGSSIRRVYEDVDVTYDQAEAALQDITESALSGLTRALATKGEGQALVVYNPLSWKRSDLAWVILDYQTVPTTVRVRDAEGRVVAGQVVSHMKIYESFERCKIVFVARDVPPVGARVYWLEALSKSGRSMRALDDFSVPITEELYKAYREKGTYWRESPPAKAAEGATLRADKAGLESDLYRVTLDEKTGHVTGLVEKRSDRQLVPEGQAGNRLELIAEGGGSDAWELRLTDNVVVLDAPTDVKVVANGPVQAVVQVSYARGGSIFEQRIALYDGIDRIDMTNQTEWRERQTALKVRWPVAVAAKEATWEIPYAWIRKPVGRQEVPAQRWLDLSDERYGLSMLNDGRYGHDTKDGTIGITLLRSTTSPDPVADVGQHAVTYSLWPHAGGLDPAQTVRRAAELNAPLMTRAVEAREGERTSISLLEVDAAGAIVSACKRAYDGKGWVIRVWETSGKAMPVTVTFCRAIKTAQETNLLEDRVGAAVTSGAALTFKLAPHEIKTFRVEL